MVPRTWSSHAHLVQWRKELTKDTSAWTTRPDRYARTTQRKGAGRDGGITLIWGEPDWTIDSVAKPCTTCTRRWACRCEPYSGGNVVALQTSSQPANALSETEKEEIMSIMNQPVYRDPHTRSCRNEGRYLASESTMYRLLRESQQLAHRQRSAPAHRYEKLAGRATTERSVELGLLKGPVRGMFFYLYLMVSRKIVAFSVHEEECAFW